MIFSPMFAYSLYGIILCDCRPSSYGVGLPVNQRKNIGGYEQTLEEALTGVDLTSFHIESKSK